MLNFYRKIKKSLNVNSYQDKTWHKSTVNYIQDKIMKDAIDDAKRRVFIHTIHNLQNISIGNMPKYK